MVFSSVVFLFFFLPLVLGVSWLLQAYSRRHEGRGVWLGLANTWLLLASLAFYAWGEVVLTTVMLASCLLNYLGGLACAPGQPRRRPLLVTVVAANLAVLAWYKYSGLLADTVARLQTALGSEPRWSWSAVALPLGISFYTFHGISYVVDVWRGKVAAARRLRDFACYYTLFPQLVAGPIVRYSEVAEQFTRRSTSADDLAEGARRFIIGLGKKTLLANQVAPLADAAFALPAGELNAPVAWLGLVAYALQIYFDFSGYSDMAVGLGRLLGFRFPENFCYPYAAASMREFWRRWHMTLSRFFRDYLYIPLGGNRAGPLRTGLHLVTVFALCGFWHGASWNFLLWGLLHGCFLTGERLLAPWLERTPARWHPLGHGYAVLAMLLSWVVFRCDTWAQAVAYYRALGSLSATGGLNALPWPVLAPDVWLALAVGLLGCVPTLAWARRWLETRLRVPSPATDWFAAVGWLGVLTLALLTVGAGAPNPFIYYRF